MLPQLGCTCIIVPVYETSLHVWNHLSYNHYVKSVRIRGYSGSYFSAFELNTKRYRVSFLIQSKCGKIRIRITPNTDTFQAVNITYINLIQLLPGICKFSLENKFIIIKTWYFAIGEKTNNAPNKFKTFKHLSKM